MQKGATTREVKLTLDADAAELLLQLAGGPRKQGEFVSKLIRAAASRPDLLSEIETADIGDLRSMVYKLAQDLAGVQSQLAQMPTALPGRESDPE